MSFSRVTTQTNSAQIARADPLNLTKAAKKGKVSEDALRVVLDNIAGPMTGGLPLDAESLREKITNAAKGKAGQDKGLARKLSVAAKEYLRLEGVEMVRKKLILSFEILGAGEGSKKKA
jgi:hypothetical protein